VPEETGLIVVKQKDSEHTKTVHVRLLNTGPKVSAGHWQLQLGVGKYDKITLSVQRIVEVFDRGQWGFMLDGDEKFLVKVLIACWERVAEGRRGKAVGNVEGLLKWLVEDVYRGLRPKKMEVVNWGEPPIRLVK